MTIILKKIDQNLNGIFQGNAVFICHVTILIKGQWS